MLFSNDFYEHGQKLSRSLLSLVRWPSTNHDKCAALFAVRRKRVLLVRFASFRLGNRGADAVDDGLDGVQSGGGM